MSRYPRGKNLPGWVGLLLCMAIGFVFTCIGTGIEPVERGALKEVTICYQEYKVLGGDTEHIRLSGDGGVYYEVHHTSSGYHLRQKLEELPAGTELELLLHPEAEYVLGIYRDGTPLLGWQTAVQKIKDEDLIFFWMGIGLWVLGAVMFSAEKISKKKK